MKLELEGELHEIREFFNSRTPQSAVERTEQETKKGPGRKIKAPELNPMINQLHNLGISPAKIAEFLNDQFGIDFHRNTIRNRIEKTGQEYIKLETEESGEDTDENEEKTETKPRKVKELSEEELENWKQDLKELYTNPDNYKKNVEQLKTGKFKELIEKYNLERVSARNWTQKNAPVSKWREQTIGGGNERHRYFENLTVKEAEQLEEDLKELYTNPDNYVKTSIGWRVRRKKKEKVENKYDLEENELRNWMMNYFNRKKYRNKAKQYEEESGEDTDENEEEVIQEGQLAGLTKEEKEQLEQEIDEIYSNPDNYTEYKKGYRLKPGTLKDIHKKYEHAEDLHNWIHDKGSKGYKEELFGEQPTEEKYNYFNSLSAEEAKEMEEELIEAYTNPDNWVETSDNYPEEYPDYKIKIGATKPILEKYEVDRQEFNDWKEEFFNVAKYRRQTMEQEQQDEQEEDEQEPEQEEPRKLQELTGENFEKAIEAIQARVRQKGALEQKDIDEIAEEYNTTPESVEEKADKFESLVHQEEVSEETEEDEQFQLERKDFDSVEEWIDSRKYKEKQEELDEQSQEFIEQILEKVFEEEGYEKGKESLEEISDITKVKHEKLVEIVDNLEEQGRIEGEPSFLNKMKEKTKDFFQGSPSQQIAGMVSQPNEVIKSIVERLKSYGHIDTEIIANDMFPNRNNLDEEKAEEILRHISTYAEHIQEQFKIRGEIVKENSEMNIYDNLEEQDKPVIHEEKGAFYNNPN